MAAVFTLRKCLVLAVLLACAALIPPAGAVAADPPVFGAPFSIGVAGRIYSDLLGPRAAIDSGGGSAIAWQELTPPGVVQLVQRVADRSRGGVVAARTVSSPGKEAFAPVWAASPRGDALIAWAERISGVDDTSRRIKVVVRRPGGRWGDVQDLGVHAGPVAAAFGTNGDAMLTLTGRRGFSSVALNSDSVRFGQVRRLDSSSSRVSVRVDRSGGAVVLWEAPRSTRRELRVAVRRPRRAIGAAQTLGSNGARPLDGSLAANDRGYALALWRVSGGGTSTVRASGLRPGATRFGAVRTLSPPRGVAFRPLGALAATDGAVVTWQDNLRDQASVYAVSRPAGGRFGTPRRLSGSALGAREPFSVQSSRGDALVVWRRQRSGELRIEVASRPAGGLFGAYAPLALPGNRSFHARVILGDTGQATAVWSGNGPLGDHAGSAVFRAGAQPVPRLLGSTVGTDAVLAGLAGGGAITSWAGGPRAASGAAMGVVRAAVEPAGATDFASPIDISDPTVEATTPTLAAAPNGLALLVWTAARPGATGTTFLQGAARE